ncbi:bifunctional folylpolyglutamate synthase/dihydrofolate synthase [Gallalistipes aquisgranensis]|uniref:bifunctional folylpolyglutamate synthase/dihydrofolate synthase n=1 Tax=Gallalistipes aquisgranensis TaxID=2779358 RepID=UPI001CF7F3C2|nr:folylpolyglutamate synthase/dihydrofolate synthase family protein [Gallalistipes aquisgranensis]MBE5034587.1 bifunctional folylpolyglutamate synthase/dihydrofolate synthase [Gallalistipes aquisgranensis]
MTYPETLDFLFRSLPVFQQSGSSAYKPGLEHTIAFNDYLGRPDRNFLSIHVAGTNGKGSVSHLLASVLQAAGYRVGLYTSPHLKDFRERIRVNGTPISEREVVEFVARHREKMVGLGLSFFEMTVGMAFDHFTRQEVEVAVVETGLGGRLDATNIIRPAASVITNIGFDHMALLGNTIPKIAAEKAGIIKPGIPAVIGEEHPESAPVFRARAQEAGADIFFAESLFRCVGDGGECLTGEDGTTRRRLTVERIEDGDRLTLELDLLGEYQRRNIVTVMAAIRILNRTSPLSISRRDIAEGCATAARTTGLRGRWEILGREPLTVCDTGHNEHGLRLVAEQLRHQRYDKLYFVLGVVNDKDLHGILPLLPPDAHYLFTQASVERALPADRLAEEAARYGLHGETVPGVRNACDRARRLASPRDMIFIGGSTFTVADL